MSFTSLEQVLPVTLVEVPLIVNGRPIPSKDTKGRIDRLGSLGIIASVTGEELGRAEAMLSRFKDLELTDTQQAASWEAEASAWKVRFKNQNQIEWKTGDEPTTGTLRAIRVDARAAASTQLLTLRDWVTYDFKSASF